MGLGKSKLHRRVLPLVPDQRYEPIYPRGGRIIRIRLVFALNAYSSSASLPSFLLLDRNLWCDNIWYGLQIYIILM